MTTISGHDLLAIESLRADVARLTAERDEAVADYEAEKRAVVREQDLTAALVASKTDLASRDATIAELQALLLATRPMLQLVVDARLNVDAIGLRDRIDVALGKEQD